ncbi:MAG: hypothetical protein ACREDR_49020, partial [Blastocatellia bacterium]
MGKTPEVRVKVHDLDSLLALTSPQERVWMYYKRREGADGKAWGKAATIAAWARIEPGTVRNARSWLVRNGWLRPNGRSKSGLPQFLAVIPQLHSEAQEVSLGNDTAVTVQLHPVSLYSETEVPTQKKLPKGLRSPSASELVSELVVAAATPFSSSVELNYGSKAVMKNLYPKSVPEGLDLNALNQVTLSNPDMDWSKYFAWQRTHKKGGLVFRSLAQFLKGVEYSLNDYANHNPKKCGTCIKAYTNGAKPGTHAYLNPELHTGFDALGRSYAEKD